MSFPSITPDSPIDKSLKTTPPSNQNNSEDKGPVQEIVEKALQSSEKSEPTLEIDRAAPSTLSDLNLESLFQITEKLLRKDQLALEGTSKGYVESLDYYWSKKVSDEQLGDLTFAIQETPKNSREKYLFNKAVITLVETLGVKDLSKATNAQPRALTDKETAFLKKHEFLQTSFPRLHNLLQFAVYQRAGHKEDSNPYYSVTEKDRKAIAAGAHQNLNPGDCLLQCLLAKSPLAVQMNLSNASEKNSAAAILTTKVEGLSEETYLRAAQNEARRGNFLPLHELLQYGLIQSKQDLYEACYELWPPVLVVKAILLSQKPTPTETQLTEVESLLAESISGFRNQVPLDVLILYGLVKIGLNKIEEAETQFAKANIPSLTFEEVQSDIEAQIKGAEKRGNKLPFPATNSAALQGLFAAADTKMKLAKWEEADKLLSVTLKTFEHYNPVIRENFNDTLVQAAYVKIKLGQWAEAKELFVKVNTVPRFTGKQKDLFAEVRKELAEHETKT